jgi:P-type Cu2+ transporter
VSSIQFAPELHLDAAEKTTAGMAAPCLCEHCGLTVPRGLIVADRREQFCCHGCETAWQLIHASGLQAWYRLASDRRAVSEGGSRDRVAGFDAPGFVERFSVDAGAGLREITLAIEGLHCAACVWLIERLGRVCPGVERSTVNFARRTVTIQWRPESVRLSRVVASLQQLGYEAAPVTPGAAREPVARENRRHLVRLGIAGAAAGNNMLIATALYLGLFQGMEAGHLGLLRLASCGEGLVSLVWPGWVFFQGAWAAIRTRTPRVDLPLALGLGAGGLWGVVNTLTGRGEIYFDSLSMLVFLLLVGRYIQFRQQRRAADAIDLLYRMTPSFARKVTAEGTVEVPAELLAAGDRIEVRASEAVPADGRILAGESTLDESILTGESRPVSRTAGEEVSAGTLNLRSAIALEVTAAGEKTRLAGILKLVQSAAADRPAIVQWADRMGGWFVMAVLAIALVTLAVWTWRGSPAAVDYMVALLVVACPCALAMSTPLALSVALGRAAGQGILIKGGDVMARLARPGRIWLDKTGTLTAGRVRVVEWIGDTRWQPQVAALEACSAHPIATAFTADSLPSSPDDAGNGWLATAGQLTVSDVNQVTGQGLTGSVDGHRLRVGRESFVRGQVLPGVPDHWNRMADQLVNRGLSPVWISVGGTVRAIAGVGDPLRPETAGLVRELTRRGWQVGILSGDHPVIVAGVARQLGIDPALALGGLSPEAKVARVRSGECSGPVLMVGDGVNDSPALAAAGVGIAVRSGAMASLQAAPVWLARSGIGEIVALLEGSRGVQRTIRTAIAVSLGYNLLAIGLAATGLISPLIAAALMPASSLSVVALAISGSGFRNPPGR